MEVRPGSGWAVRCGDMTIPSAAGTVTAGLREQPHGRMQRTCLLTDGAGGILRHYLHASVRGCQRVPEPFLQPSSLLAGRAPSLRRCNAPHHYSVTTRPFRSGASAWLLATRTHHLAALPARVHMTVARRGFACRAAIT